jgi:hypothetical protein
MIRRVKKTIKKGQTKKVKRQILLGALWGVVLIVCLAISSLFAQACNPSTIKVEFHHIHHTGYNTFGSDDQKVTTSFSINYPVVISASHISKKINHEIQKQILHLLNFNTSNADSDLKLNPIAFYKKLKEHLDEGILLADFSSEVSSPNRRLLLCKFSSYAYSGGVHGYGGTRYLNFDLSTGGLILFKDIILTQKRAQFAEFLIEKLREKFGDAYLAPENFEKSLESATFYRVVGQEDKIDGSLAEKLAIVFPEYSVASYAAGDVTLEISYEDLKPYRNDSHFFWKEIGFGSDLTWR